MGKNHGRSVVYDVNIVNEKNITTTKCLKDRINVYE